MLGDLRQHLAQGGFGIQAVEFGRTDQAIHRSGTMSARIRPGEHQVLASLLCILGDKEHGRFRHLVRRIGDRKCRREKPGI